MSTEVFLENYRLTTGAGGNPVEIGRNGPAITYRASDQKTGAPVALTIVPIEAVDPAEREHFEEKARTAMLLDHINIAKTVAFGTTDESFVFVSEFPPGETVDAWVKANGPMPPDAVLRVALQVVAALGSASFHGLNHPAIQPANLVIVTGKTAEGGWPFVKLTQFALSGLRSAPRHAEPDLGASDFASPEQLLQGKIDFRSEIYSLGATMCFLLTGVFYSAYPRSPQTKRFARPLRTLIARTLEDDPSERPQDPVLFTEELRTCLAAIERRQGLRRRFGIPFSPVVAKPPRKRRIRQAKPTPLLAPVGDSPAPRLESVSSAEVVRSRRFRWRPALAVAGGLFALGLIAALFLPEDVVTAALHRARAKPVETIGVPVGVPDTSPALATQTNKGPSTSASQTPRIAVAKPAPSINPANPPQTTKVATSEPAAAAQPPQAPPAPASAPPITAEQHSVAANEPPPTSSQSQPNYEVKSSLQPAVAAAGPVAENAAPHMDHGLSTAASATPAEGATNNRTNEPASPAESANERAQSSTEASTPEKAAPSADVADNSSTENEKAEKAHSSSSSTNTMKSRSRTSPTVAEHKPASTERRAPRALPAEPDSKPRHGSSVRARVVGMTPGGNLILLMPDGQRAIVTPEDADAYTRLEQGHRQPRRIIIEKHTYPSENPAAPYQPFLPPDD